MHGEKIDGKDEAASFFDTVINQPSTHPDPPPLGQGEAIG
jgi:hypothetical protein